MRVKRFVADTMQEAVAQVKADFGPEAVILHTKQIRRGGLFGLFSRTKVEVIAAVDARSPRRPPVRLREIEEGARRAGGAVRESAATAELSRMREELDSIKRALLASSGPAAPGTLPPPLEAWRERLLAQEVDEGLVQRILAAVAARAGVNQVGEEWFRGEVLRELTEGIACASPWQLGEDAKVQCLVGPTGVGKTTTIAKLAANFALLGGKKVALITVDTYRIAAVEQLKTYAEIIGVPLDVAFTPQELKDAMARRQGYDLVLVDTAGRSQRNKMQMAELRAFLEVFESPLIHLVLSATTRLADLLDITRQFGTLPITSLIVTKLDETTTFGSLYNLCRMTGKPLSYLTNGQSVPDDIEVAEPARVAEMILGVKP